MIIYSFFGADLERLQSHKSVRESGQDSILSVGRLKRKCIAGTGLMCELRTGVSSVERGRELEVCLTIHDAEDFANDTVCIEDDITVKLFGTIIFSPKGPTVRYTARYPCYFSHPGLGGEASPHLGRPRRLCSTSSACD